MLFLYLLVFENVVFGLCVCGMVLLEVMCCVVDVLKFV